MGTSALNADERVETVEFTEEFLIVALKDGRRLGAVGVVSAAGASRQTAAAELGNFRRRLWAPLAGAG